MLSTEQTIQVLIGAAKPVIYISKVHLDKPKWYRNVPRSDHRYGPWMEADWELLNEQIWKKQEPCMYLVIGSDRKLRYVGISRRKMKDRWRVSPAYNPETKERLTGKRLFHSQCWVRIENECSRNPDATFLVKCLTGTELEKILETHEMELSGLLTLRGDAEGIAAGVERWICNRSNTDIAKWNVAMTGRARSLESIRDLEKGSL